MNIHWNKFPELTHHKNDGKWILMWQIKVFCHFLSFITKSGDYVSSFFENNTCEKKKNVHSSNLHIRLWKLIMVFKKITKNASNNRESEVVERCHCIRKASIFWFLPYLMIEFVKGKTAFYCRLASLSLKQKVKR